MNLRGRPLTFHTAGGASFADPSFINTAKTQRGRYKRNPSRRFISCEIEVSSLESWGETIMRECERKNHSIVYDGSLPDSGFEINMAPAQGDVFIDNVVSLCAALHRHGAEVDRHCGMHVHVDASDCNYWDVRKLCLLYSSIEEALYSCVSPSRRRSTYCRPCANKLLDVARAKKPKERFAQRVYGVTDGRQVRSLKHDKYVDQRYDAVNVHSWLHRGTIELRMHHGTVNAQKIFLWGMLWAGVLDFAYRNSEQTIKALPTNDFERLLAICPTDEVRTHIVSRRDHFLGQ